MDRQTMSEASRVLVSEFEYQVMRPIKRTLNTFLNCLIAGFVITVAVHASPLLRDDSDEPGWFEPRSGVHITTDKLTGCQYLRKGDGITPRLDRDGKQICK